MTTVAWDGAQLYLILCHCAIGILLFFSVFHKSWLVYIAGVVACVCACFLVVDFSMLMCIDMLLACVFLLSLVKAFKDFKG